MRSRLLVLGLAALLALSGCPDDPTPPGGTPDTGLVEPADAGETDAGEPACTDDCASGTQICDTAGSYQTCGQYDEDDCLELSPAIPCAQTESCQTDRCVATCQHECNVDITVCGGATTVLVCGNFDADACREFGGSTPCEANEICEAGECVPDTQPCTDECQTEGQKSCSGDAVRTCGYFDQDSCLDLSAPDACGSAERCQGGVCVLNCQDDCTAGAKECSGAGYRSCGQHDADSCLDWSAVTACADGESCNNGTCATTCADECPTAGTPVCTSNNGGYQQCGQFDADSCLDRSTAVPCPAGYACSNGACVSTCTDDCTLGDKRCGSDGHSVETCANYDLDTCLEWGGAAACAGGAPCVDDVCTTPCTNECPASGAKECVAGQQATRSCGEFDQDSCLDWSTASACESWQVCQDGACVTGPMPAKILINELVYDSAGTDTAPGNNLFVELWGVPGQSLDGMVLVGVNGAGGTDYNPIELDGKAIGTDGYFLLAHPAGALTAVADLTNTAVDYQQGPDSVQLRWRGQVMDAIGYGSFGGSDVFGGEGGAAPAATNGKSLSRDESHADTGDNGADFTVQAVPSPRAAAPACTDECTPENSLKCSGTQVQSCVRNADADSCLEWSAAAACSNGGTCVNDVCVTCSDECPSAGARQCSDNQIQHCVADADADACLEWTAPAACPNAGEVCQGTSCQVPCADECQAAGATKCSGSQITTCDDHDADGCLEWSAASACPSSQVCANDACQAESAPEVVLITPQGSVQTTQGATHRVLADVTAAPGRTLTEVRYYANGVQFASTAAAPHETSYVVPAVAATGSTVAIQVKATDSAGVVGSSAFAFLQVRNDLPVATFTATITSASVVTVDASAVSDTETPSADLQVCWDWNDDGTCETAFSTTKITTHDFGASGTFAIGMKVKDAVGQVSSTSRTVTFSNVEFVGGLTLSESTLWYGTRIITGDVVVAAGATLTIDAGTQVLFVNADGDANGVGDWTLNIQGALVVNGTAADPVVFTGHSATGKVTGAWDRIVLSGTTPSSITHAIVEYADVWIEVKNASTLTNVTVRKSRNECIKLNNADNASLTDVTTTECGDSGVIAAGGSIGVTVTRLTSTLNAQHGIAIAGSSAVTATGCLLSENQASGAKIGVGSTLNLSDSISETNADAGLHFLSTSMGSVRQNQIRRNGAEGVLLENDASGNPMPVINANNIFSNSTTGGRRHGSASTSATLTATASASASTSAVWTAPAGSRIRRVYVSYSENYSTSSATLETGSGTVLRTFSSSSSGEWVYVPAGTTTLRVRVTGGSSYYNNTITASQVDYIFSDGEVDVVALVDLNNIDLRSNYLGTFPTVLSRISMSANTALDVQGFVGVPYDASWDAGPYKAGALTTQSWSGSIYVTGNITIAAGQVVTVQPGTHVMFVAHDQNVDGAGDFSLTATGRFDVAGTSGSTVTLEGYGALSGDAFQTITLSGAAAEASTLRWATVRQWRTGLTLRGSSALEDVTVSDSSADGISLINADGASLTRVTVESNGDSGLTIGNGSTGVTVSRLLARLNANRGVAIAGGSTPAITDSTIRENGSHGIVVTASNPTLDYNLVTYNEGAGIWIEGPSTATAQRNVVKYNKDSGAVLWTTAGGSPTPTLQYSNIYGNAVAGSTRAAMNTACGSVLTATASASASTSAVWTAPAGSTIRRAWVSYTENYSSSSATLETGSGAVLKTFSASSSGEWVYLPAGTTTLRVRVTGGSSYYNNTITASQVELVSRTATDTYELVALTDSGQTMAKFNYWTPDFAQVQAEILQPRASSVDYSGFTGFEYPSDGGTNHVGPRP